MRVRYQAAPHPESAMMATCFKIVGVAGFEPATSCSQSRRDDRATLHPETIFQNFNRCAKIGLNKKIANPLFL